MIILKDGQSINAAQARELLVLFGSDWATIGDDEAEKVLPAHIDDDMEFTLYLGPQGAALYWDNSDDDRGRIQIKAHPECDGVQWVLEI